MHGTLIVQPCRSGGIGDAGGFKSPSDTKVSGMLNKTSGLSLRNPSSFSFKKVKFRFWGNLYSKIRTHDGIVGATYMLSVILAAATSIQWLWVAGVVAGFDN